MKKTLYSRRSNLIIAFHGCDKSVADKVVQGIEGLKKSSNTYDWLGNGVYFWENNEQRAKEFAEGLKKRGKIENPAVIGAVIDLGYCMDLTDSMYLQELKDAYNSMIYALELSGSEIPKNESGGSSIDLLKRNLDCAVIQYAHKINERSGGESYDSVRGVFWEGKPLYDNAGFKEKNHIQICVRNLNCIKGYFLPRNFDDSCF